MNCGGADHVASMATDFSPGRLRKRRREWLAALANAPPLVVEDKGDSKPLSEAARRRLDNPEPTAYDKPWWEK